MEKQTLVSVIVPVYNSAKYLDKCLRSIMDQTFKEIEIIVVNDGSLDDSEKICIHYAKMDKRVKYIKKAHGGLVSARKEGLKNANGSFVCWVDSDDWIEQEYIAGFVDLQKKTGADIVAAAHYHDIGLDSAVIKNGLKAGLYEVKDIMDRILYTGNFYEYGINPHLVTKMSRIECIRWAEYSVDDSIVAGEDAAATYIAIARSKKICVSELCGYHYVQHAKTMTKTVEDNEEKKISNLISYMKGKFLELGIYEQLTDQLHMYEKYITVLRKIELLDEKDSGLVLMPYGGFAKGEKVILYGAGGVGQSIYRYIQKKLNVVAWIDKNYQKYVSDGYDVKGLDALSKAEGYESIIIANISNNTASVIRQQLIKSGIEEKRIKWFSSEFLQEDVKTV